MGQICSKYKPKNKKETLYKLAREEPQEILPTLPRNKISLRYSYFPITIQKPQTLLQRSHKLEYIEPVNVNAFLKKISQFNQKFSHFLQHHASLKYLKEASFDLKSPFIKSHFKKSQSVFKTPKALQKLRFQVEPFTRLNNKGFDYLCEGLKKQSGLKFLKFGLTESQDLSGKEMGHLMRSIQRFKRLEDLEITFSGQGQFFCFDAKALSSLGKSIKRLSNLKSLSFTMLAKTDNQGMKLFLQNVKRARKLKELNLYFGQCQGNTSRFFDHLRQSFKGMPNLENLTLSFQKCSAIFSDYVINFLSTRLGNFKSLKNLKVDLTSEGSSDVHLEQFWDSLAKIPGLTHIEINLKKDKIEWVQNEYSQYKDHCFFLSNHNKQIKNEELESLANFFKSHRVISTLIFDYQRCENMTDKTFQLFAKIFKDNPTVKNLIIDFSRIKGNFTDKGLASLAEALNPTEIECLKLKFHSASELTNEAIESLAKAIEKLTSLQSLFLDFRESCKIGDQALENLAKSLKKKMTLKSLSLDFSNCGGFSDERFVELGESLQTLTSLEKLFLIFSKNGLITDEAFIPLSDSLKNLMNLRATYINFSWCPKITEKAVDYLWQQLRACKNVEQITLNFEKYSEVEITKRYVKGDPEQEKI